MSFRQGQPIFGTISITVILESGLHFTDPNAKTRDTKDKNEVTSRHKDQLGKDTDLDALVFKDDESRENSFDDVEDDPRDTSNNDPQGTLKDDHQDKPAKGGAGEKDNLDESDHMVIMLDKMTRMEVVMTALSKGNQTA
uniref:Uncharacterized protein n=1 Tax=Cannabis sativa TaxID=3483 RepID=A0A803QCJ2_CANSA